MQALDKRKSKEQQGTARHFLGKFESPVTMGQPKSSHGFRLSSLALKYLLRKNKTKTTFCSNMLLKKTEYKKAQSPAIWMIGNTWTFVGIGCQLLYNPLANLFSTCAATSKVDSPCQHRTLQNLVSLTILVTRTSERKSGLLKLQILIFGSGEKGKKKHLQIYIFEKSHWKSGNDF